MYLRPTSRSVSVIGLGSRYCDLKSDANYQHLDTRYMEIIKEGLRTNVDPLAAIASRRKLWETQIMS